MDAPGEDVEITAQEQTIDEETARANVQSKLLNRVKQYATGQDVISTTLKHKPYYKFDTVVTKRVFMGDDIVHEGVIVVDGLTGISRPLLADQLRLTTTPASQESLISPDLDHEEALQEAKSRRMQVEHREKGTVVMDEDAERVYKPVWLVELSNGDVQVVDGTDGRVVGDTILS